MPFCCHLRLLIVSFCCLWFCRLLLLPLSCRLLLLLLPLTSLPWLLLSLGGERDPFLDFASRTNESYCCSAAFIAPRYVIASMPISITSRCVLGNPSNHLKASCVADERTPLLRSAVTSASVFSKKIPKSKTEWSWMLELPLLPSSGAEILEVPLLMLWSDFVFEVVLSLALVAFFLPSFFFPAISQPEAEECKRNECPGSASFASFSNTERHEVLLCIEMIDYTWKRKVMDERYFLCRKKPNKYCLI